MRGLLKRALLITAMVSSLGLVAPSLASATTTSSSPTPGATPMQIYRLALHTYNHERHLIDQAYHKACVKARGIELSQLHRAKSVAAKSIIRSNYRATIVAATTTWQDALAALGSPPVAPPVGLHKGAATSSRARSL